MSQVDGPAPGGADGVVVVAASASAPQAIRRALSRDDNAMIVLRGADHDVRAMAAQIADARVVPLPSSVSDRSADAVVAAMRAQYRALQVARARHERMELDLRHAQKMDAVGQLASGIAHEINTPIQFVGDSVFFLEGAFEDLIGLVRLAQESPGDAEALAARIDNVDLGFLVDEIPRAFERTRGGCERVSTIVRAMRQFARSDDVDMAPADLVDAVKSTVVVAASKLKYRADVRFDLDPLPAVRCRVGDLNQVFLNLLVNAADAIEDAGPQRGQITVSTRLVGDVVEIRISDTGCGIEPLVAERIFEPFFTTKEVGRGTGQGLAISHAIVVERHGGELFCESEVGVGTTFVVRLPVQGRRAVGDPP